MGERFKPEKQGPKRRGGRAARLKSLQGRPAQLSLVEKGFANYTERPDEGRVCVIACGAIAREILDIVIFNDLDHIALTCLPAKLHATPDKIPALMEKAISDARRAGFQHIFCGYADCGTGGALDRILEREGIARLPGAHCYAFFNGVEDFAKREDEDMRAFYLTDFLARHFDALTWQPLGLDRHPELITDYFGAYEKIVFLNQNENRDLFEKAQAIAARLKLSFEYRNTGYGDLTASMKETKIAPESNLH